MNRTEQTRKLMDIIKEGKLDESLTRTERLARDVRSEAVDIFKDLERKLDDGVDLPEAKIETALKKIRNQVGIIDKLMWK